MATDILIIAAHPDDAELGMGGTIAAMTAAGLNTALVDLSNGEPTPYGSPEKRAKESAAAAEILGLSRRVTLDIPNREIFDTVDNRKKVAAVIRELRPRVLFVPYWDDAHPDHIQASQLSVAARFYSKLLKYNLPFEPHLPARVFYYFGIHIRLHISPSFIFDTSESFEKKIEAVKAYRSQFVEYKKNQFILEKIRIEDAYWGTQISASFGEPFVCKENLRIDRPEALLAL